MNRFAALLLGAAIAAIGTTANGQEFPSKPITLINPYAGGGSSEIISRTIGDKLHQLLGQPVVVDNRPGGGTAIGAAAVARSPADGYTLLQAGAPTHIITPTLLKDANYKGIEDFTPIATVALVPNVLVVPADRPYKTVAELVDTVKKANGTMSFASVGIGSIPQFLGVLFQVKTGTKLNHVPYTGAGPAAIDVAGGRVDLAFLNLPGTILGQIQSGKLRALAVASDKRAAQLPDVPTMKELGYPDISMSTWFGISAPAGTPKPVIDKLDKAIAQILAMQDVKDRFAQVGMETYYQGAADFTKFLAWDKDRMIELIKAGNIEAK